MFHFPFPLPVHQYGQRGRGINLLFLKNKRLLESILYTPVDALYSDGDNMTANARQIPHNVHLGEQTRVF